MTKEKFLKLIQSKIKFDQEVDKLEQMNIRIIDSQLFDYSNFFFDECFSDLSETDRDILTNFLYENIFNIFTGKYNIENPEPMTITENEQTITIDNLDDLYAFLYPNEE